jgi:hypothetical protein
MYASSFAGKYDTSLKQIVLYKHSSLFLMRKNVACCREKKTALKYLVTME